MSKYKFIIFILVAIIISGCINSNNLPVGAITGNSGTVTVFSPSSNDSVGIGSTAINYVVNPVEKNQSVELYINGIYQSTFFTTISNSKPFTLTFDSTQIGSRFSYFLKYYDSNGSFAISDTLTNLLVTLPRVLPKTPINISLLTLSPTKINISWIDDTPGVLFYEVWRKDGFTGTWNNIFGPLSPSTFNINDSNLIPGIIYLYKIRSKNSFGFSEFSEPINNAGVGSSGSFAPPTNLVAIQLSNSPFAVKLDWEDNIPNENLFKIERNDNISIFSQFQIIGTVANNVTTFTDNTSGLFGGRNYKYRIKAYSNTDSSWSNVASITLQ